MIVCHRHCGSRRRGRNIVIAGTKCLCWRRRPLPVPICPCTVMTFELLSHIQRSVVCNSFLSRLWNATDISSVRIGHGRAACAGSRGVSVWDKACKKWLRDSVDCKQTYYKRCEYQRKEIRVCRMPPLLHEARRLWQPMKTSTS